MLAEKDKAFKVGPGFDEGVYVIFPPFYNLSEEQYPRTSHSYATSRQGRRGTSAPHITFTIDNQHVQDAVSKGAKILVGGKRGERTAYHPTILTDVTQECVRFVSSTPITHPD